VYTPFLATLIVVLIVGSMISTNVEVVAKSGVGGGAASGAAGESRGGPHPLRPMGLMTSGSVDMAARSSGACSGEAA
jgi:hypothetical protein